MSLYFEARLFETRKVGKHIKSTKLMFRWVFTLESNEYTIVLYCSRLSGKRKILLNNDIYFSQKKSPKKYERYSVEIEGVLIEVYRDKGNAFDLSINNRKFGEFYGVALKVKTEAEMFESYNSRNGDEKTLSDFQTQSKLSESNAIRKTFQTGKNFLYYETVGSDEESDSEVPKSEYRKKEERLNTCPDEIFSEKNREIKSPSEMFDLLDLEEEKGDPVFTTRGSESTHPYNPRMIDKNQREIPIFVNQILSNNPFLTEMAQRPGSYLQ